MVLTGDAKTAYQKTTSEAFWDIPVYAEHNQVRANRIDARLVSHERKEVCTIEMSCPWAESRAKKDDRGKDTQVWAHDVGTEAEIQWLLGLNSTT